MSNHDGLRRWQYSNIVAHEGDDVRKLDHHATNIDTGAITLLDYTPYRDMPAPVFDAFVALGFPPSPGIAPWTDAEIIAALNERVAA